MRLFQVARLGGSTAPLDDLLPPVPGTSLNTWALPGDPAYRSGPWPGIGWGSGAAPLSQNETAVGPFAASCWYFGRDLHDAVGVPLGLVLSSIGGTTDEMWSSADALEKCAPDAAAAAPPQRCDPTCPLVSCARSLLKAYTNGLKMILDRAPGPCTGLGDCFFDADSCLCRCFCPPCTVYSHEGMGA